MNRYYRKMQGLKYALTGIGIAIREEMSFQSQIGFGLFVLLLSWYFHITTTELLLVVFMIGLVMSAELLNTAIEELCDMVKNEQHPHVAKIKDLAAAGVLVASFTSIVVGLSIFIPYFMRL